MSKPDLQSTAGQKWRWMFLFSCLALFHSLWTGWLAPLGVFVASPLFGKLQFLGFRLGVLRIGALFAGIAVGYIDAQLLGVIPTVGTAFLIIIAMVCLGESVGALELSEQRRLNLLGSFLGAWAGSFLLLVVLGKGI